jgi:Mg2+ and Co2+ transporter CorA
MYANTESDITGEIREMEDAIAKMARHSTVVGDMLMSMKIHALSKNVKRLKEALAKTRPINNIV